MKINIYKLVSGAKQGLFALALNVFFGTAYAQTTYTFNYTGAVQTINLPPGNYSIQCWGADGGNATDGTNPMSGGKGGFSTGFYMNPASAIHNIYVGEHGGNAAGQSNLGGGGGGMSDIALASNTNVVIIAAGGGGGATSGSASEASTGGDGGGLTGGTAIDGTGVSGGSAATGGSQSAGGFATAGTYGGGSPGGYGYGGGGSNGAAPAPSQSGTMHGAGGVGGAGGNGGWNGGGGACTVFTGNEHSGGGGAGYYGGGGGRGDGGAGGGGSSYIGGVTSATTIMFGQPGFVPNPDATGNGHIRIIELCTITLTATGVNSHGICTGNSVTLTTNAISNYSWSTGATSSSLVVSPGSTTLYSLTATSPSNCTSSAAVTITVNPIPVLVGTPNSTLLCASAPVTITADGASTYTWAGGAISNTIVVNPAVTTAYSFTGTSFAGCVGYGTANVIVNALTITVPSSATICKGKQLSVAASGGVSYWWSNGSPFSTLVATPLSSTSYTLDAIDANNCQHTSILNVTVNNNPTVTASADRNTICKGEEVTLTAGGTAASYTWNNPASTTAIVTVTPAIDITYYYNVTGTDNNGCESTAVVSVKVEGCTGLFEAGSNFMAPLEVFPNPNSGSFTIRSEKNQSLEISNELGQIIKRIDISEQTGNEALIKDLPAGVYFVSTSNRSVNYKIVVSN